MLRQLGIKREDGASEQHFADHPVTAPATVNEIVMSHEATAHLYRGKANNDMGLERYS